MSENTTGSGSGLKVAKGWNFGMMAGVRQLRDEEYEDQYKMNLKPPGSSNYVKIAQEQFNMETSGSGYMAEEPGKEPLWRKTPEHLKKLRLPGLLYDGTARDDPNDSYENGIAGQWSAKMRKHGQVGKAPLPGYSGAVSGYYAPGGGEEDAPEGEHEVAVVEGSAEGLALKAERKADLKARATAFAQRALSKDAKSVGTAGSDPRVGGGSATGSGTTGQDPSAGSAGWEVGSQNHSNLLALKRALVSWGQKTKSSKAKKGGGGAE